MPGAGEDMLNKNLRNRKKVEYHLKPKAKILEA